MKERTDQELLCLVLRTQFRRVAGKDVREIVDADQDELGLSDVAYERLMAGIELGKRVAEPKPNYNAKICSTQQSVAFCKLHFARLIAEGLQEEFHVVTLNTKHRMINSHLVTRGTLDASLIHPREIFRPAIKDAARSVLLAHNHPSGDPTPSKEDYAVTQQLNKAGDLLGIQVLDHIVLAKENCVSIRECDR